MSAPGGSGRGVLIGAGCGFHFSYMAFQLLRQAGEESRVFKSESVCNQAVGRVRELRPATTAKIVSEKLPFVNDRGVGTGELDLDADSRRVRWIEDGANGSEVIRLHPRTDKDAGRHSANEFATRDGDKCFVGRVEPVRSIALLEHPPPNRQGSGPEPFCAKSSLGPATLTENGWSGNKRL